MFDLQKVGYLLIGFSGGLAAASLLYDAESRRAVGDIEEYVPLKDRKDSDEKDEEVVCDIIKDVRDEANNEISINKRIDDFVDKKRNNIDDKISELTERARERRDENSVVNYSSMYASREGRNEIDKNVMKEIEDIIEDVRDEVVEAPSDDDVEDIRDDDLVRERVEEWMEVYLDENPQDFITLIFYEEDETLCDDREQLISNPEEVVGEVALDRLVSGGPGAENGTIFVRNLKTMLNYEVVLDSGAYSETVLGIFESKLGKGDGGDVGK